MSSVPRASRDIVELLSDYFREASVLVLVFSLLDKYFRDGNNIDWTYGAQVFGLSAALFIVGVIFEIQRDRE